MEECHLLTPVMFSYLSYTAQQWGGPSLHQVVIKKIPQRNTHRPIYVEEILQIRVPRCVKLTRPLYTHIYTLIKYKHPHVPSQSHINK